MTLLAAFLSPSPVSRLLRTALHTPLTTRTRSSPMRLPASRRLVTGCAPSAGSASDASATQTGAKAAPHGTAAVLAALRARLTARGVDAFIVPTTDPHNSEYTAAHYARRAFVSGFDGSAGTAVVTSDAALLWTDGRYFLQAEEQLDAAHWQLMRAGLPDTPTIADWLASSLRRGARVGVDPLLHSVSAADGLREKLASAGAELVPLAENPVDDVWADARPPAPFSPVRVHDVRYAGVTVADKLGMLRARMTDKNASHMLLSMLDEVAWLYNVRGGDVPYNPVVTSYALVCAEAADGAVLYVDDGKLDDAAVRAALADAGVRIRPYDAVVPDLESLAGDGAAVWLDPASTSIALADAAGPSAVRETTPVPLAKALKNDAELAGMRAAHARDGAALSALLCWLEREVVDKAEELRARQAGFVSPSFDTIAGVGKNGAVIHYSPQPDTCASAGPDDMVLIDSGGQYVDGTTDVTRTVHLGTPTARQRRCFTRVLQGHIAMDSVTFPAGTTGLMLDALARTALWADGLDYRHGTGHGVGACLNVHEGPQSISSRPGSNKAALKAGMIVSNEPGYYEDGEFGIRIENLVSIVERETPDTFGGEKYLGFERLTHAPIERKLMDTAIMSEKEIAWVDRYHADVWDLVSPLVEDDEVRSWLREKTVPLEQATTVTGNGGVTSAAASVHNA